MALTQENQTEVTDGLIPDDAFNALPPGYDLIRITPETCACCKQGYYKRYYLTPSSLMISERTPCNCQRESNSPTVKRGIDVTSDLDALFRSWNMIYGDKQYNLDSGVFADAEQERLKNNIAKYILKFKLNSKGICFNGAAGRGKTYLALCIATAVQEKGYSVLAIKSIDLLNRLRRCYSSDDPDQETRVMRVLKNVELLVIDDIGTEKVTGWAEEKLYEVIDYRHDKLTTIFTTNLTGDEMSRKMGQALASRIFGTGYQVAVKGRDRRLVNSVLNFDDI